MSPSSFPDPRAPLSGNDAPPRGVAVVGCGYWGVNYVRILNELPQARLVAVCDPRRDRLEEVGQRFPAGLLTQDLEEALRRSDVEAVVIATGATTHHDLTTRCLQAGKHVLVEKPLATDSGQAHELVELAARRGRTLMVGHTFLYNPAVRQLRSYLDEGFLGRVYYLYARRTNLGPIRHDVNALWDLAPHDISIFNYLLGHQPDWVSATGAGVLNNRREDVGFVTLGYGGGIIGNIHVSWVDPNKVRDLVVVGSERRVAFDDVSVTERLRVFEKGVAPDDRAADAGGYPFEIRDGDIISPRIEMSEPLKNQVRHFLECVATGARPDTPGADGLAVVRVMEAVARSMEQNGAPVAVEGGFVPAGAEAPGTEVAHRH